jgi:hypothetical protein
MRNAWAMPDNAKCMGNESNTNTHGRLRIPISYVSTMPESNANTHGRLKISKLATLHTANMQIHRYAKSSRYAQKTSHMLTNTCEKFISSSPKLHQRLSQNSERSKHRWKQEDIKSSVFDAITELANTTMPNSRRFSLILASNTNQHHRIPSIKTALRNA